MPSKPMKLGTRYNPCSDKSWREFRKQTGIDIDFKTFKEIIWQTNKEISDTIINDEIGAKIPASLGYSVVTKYKSEKQPIDWINTRKLGKVVPLLNLHSFGYIHHIKWFFTGCGSKNIPLYKFKGCRYLTRSVSKSIKKGKKYHNWVTTDFRANTKAERIWDRFYNKQKND